MKLNLISISLSVNGEFYKIRYFDYFSLLDLIRFFDYNAQLIVLEYNEKILPPKYWSIVQVNEGDKIEILTLVGGG